MGRFLGGKIPMGIAFTINLGVAPLLFLQVLYGQFIYVSSVLMAVFWLSIFVLTILAYYGAYLYQFKFDGWGPARIWPIGVAVILLLVVGFFFTNSLLLMIDPKAWPAYFQQPKGMMIHWAERSLIPRYLHFVISSVAVGGLVTALYGRWSGRRGEAGGESLVYRGLVLFGCASILQFVIGSWYLGTLPNQVLVRIVFEDPLSFPLFLISIIAALASIIFSFSQKLGHTLVSALITIFFMVLFRFAVRTGYLEPYLAAGRPETATQFGPALMFVLVLIAGLLVMAYLVRLSLAAGKESSS
ncbi:MAG: hypothetical protein ABII06_17610, partial [Pseudomonadota bacterium]